MKERKKKMGSQNEIEKLKRRDQVAATRLKLVTVGPHTITK
jgi:hypothetical protein